MIRKTLALATMITAGIAIARNWPDLRRYLTIKQMSGHQMHPENVPAEGRIGYPQRHEAGVPDGTGDFEPTRRGGPAHA